MNTRAELADAAAVLRDARQQRAHARGRHDRRSGTRPGSSRVSSSSRTRRSIRSRSCAAGRRVAAGAEVGPHVGRRSTPRSGPAPSSAPSVTFAPARCWAEGEGRHVRRDQELRASAQRTKVPHLSYIGDAEVGEDTNVGAGNITANFPHQPGQPKGRTTIGRQRQDRHSQWVRGAGRDRGRCMDCGRVVHNRGCPSRIARRIPAEAGHERGLSRWKAQRLS